MLTKQRVFYFQEGWFLSIFRDLLIVLPTKLTLIYLICLMVLRCYLLHLIKEKILLRFLILFSNGSFEELWAWTFIHTSLSGMLVMKILMNNRLNVKTLFPKPNLNVQTCMHLTELMNDSIFKKVVFLIKHISLNILSV